jgi:hypothetical protein
LALPSTTQLGLQRLEEVTDTFVPGTAVERLYKRAQKAHEESDDTDGAYVLTADIIAPTPTEIAAVEAEVDDEALTRAVETVKSTVRSSGRQRVDVQKIKENKEIAKALGKAKE